MVLSVQYTRYVFSIVLVCVGYGMGGKRENQQVQRMPLAPSIRLRYARARKIIMKGRNSWAAPSGGRRSRPGARKGFPGGMCPLHVVGKCGRGAIVSPLSDIDIASHRLLRKRFVMENGCGTKPNLWNLGRRTIKELYYRLYIHLGICVSVIIPICSHEST